MSLIHKSTFANAYTFQACVKVINWLSPSKLLTTCYHANIFNSRVSEPSLRLLNSPVLVFV